VGTRIIALSDLSKHLEVAARYLEFLVIIAHFIVITYNDSICIHLSQHQFASVNGKPVMNLALKNQVYDPG
jgi:hypothetical protein